MQGEIITQGEMEEARKQAEVLETLINQKPSLKPHLSEAQSLLLTLGYKGWP